MKFTTILKYDPLPPLLSSEAPFLSYFVNRDLLGRSIEPIEEDICTSKPVLALLRKQLNDGSWKSHSPAQKNYPAINYNLIETWKHFRFLVEKYGLTITNPATEKAAEYLFSCQTEEGDIRGILANQYTTYYTGAILSLVIQAGYEKDTRVEKGLKWLLSMRQDDGGWLASPLMSLGLKFQDYAEYTAEGFPTVGNHDKSKPSSHNWTGMVIRAFAVHPEYKNIPEAIHAGKLLKQAFFKKDIHYTSMNRADYWVQFQFPYWWNNLVAAMDSLSRLGFSKDDPDIKNAINWFIEHQQPSGLWNLMYGKKQPKKDSPKMIEEKLWISFKICQILNRLI